MSNALPPTPATPANRLRRLRRQQWLLGAACTLLVLIGWRAGLLDRMELPTIDWRTRWFNTWAAGPSPDVVVMTIDTGAIEAEVGSWPWSREIMADAIRELHAAGAKTIALDVLFDSPWTRGPGEQGGPDPDEVLAQAIAAHGSVVLPFRTSEGDAGASASRGHAPSVTDLVRDREFRDALAHAPDDVASRIIAERLIPARSGGKSPVTADQVRALIPAARTIIGIEERSSVHAPGLGVPVVTADATVPIPGLTSAAAAIGDVAIVSGIAFDSDHVFRRFPLWTNLGDDRLWPSFSLAAVANFLECPVSHLRPGAGSVTEIPGTPPRFIRSTNMRADGEERPFVHLLTWPRGGNSWRGQFTDPRASTPREVRIIAALMPYLIRRDAAANLRTLEHLLQIAQGLNLGDYSKTVDLVREIQGVPIRDDRWASLLEQVAAGADAAAAEAADYLQFAGEVDLTKLSAEDALTYVRHREVAENIPVIVRECREARGAIDAARVRLRDIVSNRLVFIGWAATGVAADAVNTSLEEPLTPGVYIHAAAASSFLNGFVRRPVPVIVDACFIVLLGVGGIAAARRVSVWLAAVLIVAVIGAWFLFAGVVVWDAGWRIAGVSAPSIAAASSWLAVLLHRLLVEQRMRRRTEERFRAYVSPAVVDELVNNPQLDSMTPQRRELTIMFCDVTGFTAIAEKLGAEGTARFLTGYLGRMTDTLLRHGATIDKYLGDGIMAFWGAPIQDPRHTRNACRAATSLVRAVAEFGARDAGPGGPGPLHIRIGLAAGDVMVGDFGNPPIRSSYTVLGDACNIAARLERACKLLGTTILVSAGVRAAAGEGFLWRPLGRFMLHGRLAPEPIFELIGASAPGGRGVSDGSLALMRAPGRARVDATSLHAWIQATEDAITSFTAARWDEARERFTTLARDFGDEPLARLYLDAIDRRTSGEPLDEPVDAIILSES